MKIKYLFLLFILFFVSMILFGCDPTSIGSADYGTAQINGYVMDVDSKMGIGDVTILTSPNYDTLKSDPKGGFFILNFQLSSNPQDIVIIGEKYGYKTAQINTTLHMNETSNVTILLEQK